MKYAKIIDGVVDAIALERPGHFETETYTETVTKQVPRQVEKTVPLLDEKGDQAFRPDGETPLTRIEIETAYDDVAEDVERQRQVFVPDLAYEEVPDDVFGGFIRVNGKIIAPALPEPEPPARVSARQFKMQLAILGHLAKVEKWVREQPELVQIAYDNSATFDRDDPALQTGFKALGFSEADLTAFYAAAAKL